ncbi:MAG: hypothetical protein Q9M30_00345 [Mariprofundaceae bacterium]|nr:hypothetical protein [Mariprofundaceae bacterium]
MTEHDADQVHALDSRTKLLGNIVHHLKAYPFLLITVAGLIILTIVMSFDIEKLKELKPLLYGVVMLPLVMQFYFEAQKQREKRERQRSELQQSSLAADAVSGNGHLPSNSVPPKFTRKGIAGLVLLFMIFSEVGNTPDAETSEDLLLGAFVLGWICLYLGVSANNDVKNGRATGKALAIIVIALSALLLLGSLGWMGDIPSS